MDKIKRLILVTIWAPYPSKAMDMTHFDQKTCELRIFIKPNHEIYKLFVTPLIEEINISNDNHHVTISIQL